MDRRTVGRWTQRVALGAAGVVAVIAVLPVGPAAGGVQDGDTPPDNLGYSGAASAIGVQGTFNTNPEPSNVPDVFDLQVPAVSSVFDSTGQSEAVAHVANGNGAAQIPGLFCLAAPACGPLNGGTSQIPGIGQYVQLPLDNPGTARASYPKPTHDEAPKYKDQKPPTTFPPAGSGSPVSVSVGTAVADATPKGVDTTSTSGLVGSPVIASGSAVTTSQQKVSKGAFITFAMAKVSNISLGGSAGLNIDSVVSIANVSTVPGKRPVDKSSVTASGVTVAGQPATIDQDGVHVAGLPSAVVQGQLLRAGITDARLIAPTSTDDASGHSAVAGGLVVHFDTAVQGINPDVGIITQPVVSACSMVIKPLTDNGLPNACNGVGTNPNAEYYGQATFAQAGVQNSSFVDNIQSTDTFDTTDPTLLDSTPTDPTSTDPTTTGTATTPPATAPVPTDTTVASGPVLTTTSAGLGTTDVGGVLPGTTGTAAPVVAGGAAPQRAAVFGESMTGVHGRLLWFFPVLLLAGVGILAGRFGKAPSRIPRAA